MKRRLQAGETWDLVIVGGGATGLGIAIDAASRGYRTALLEQADFAKGTSSRSTKLIHGGVRYLRQGNTAAAAEASGKAKMWCWIAVAVGIGGGLLYMILVLFGVLASA